MEEESLTPIKSLRSSAAGLVAIKTYCLGPILSTQLISLFREKWEAELIFDRNKKINIRSCNSGVLDDFIPLNFFQASMNSKSCRVSPEALFTPLTTIGDARGGNTHMQIRTKM